MAPRKFRVPFNLILLPAGFFAIFASVFGGVAYTQRPNSDWTVCLIMSAGLALTAAVYFLAPVDWISEQELKDLEAAAWEKETEREVDELLNAKDDATFDKLVRRRTNKVYGCIALMIILLNYEFFLGRAKMANGESGTTVLGMTLGTWRVLNRSWTGGDLLFLGALVALLVYILREGFGLWRRANEPRDS